MSLLDEQLINMFDKALSKSFTLGQIIKSGTPEAKVGSVAKESVPTEAVAAAKAAVATVENDKNPPKELAKGGPGSGRYPKGHSVTIQEFTPKGSPRQPWHGTAVGQIRNGVLGQGSVEHLIQREGTTEEHRRQWVSEHHLSDRKSENIAKCDHGLMKSDNCVKCMTKSEGENMTLDEKKAAAKKNLTAMVSRMQERKLEKSACVASLAKSLNAQADKLGEIWDRVAAASLAKSNLAKSTMVEDAGSNLKGIKTNPEGEQSDVPSQMKDGESEAESKGKVPGMPEYEDRAGEKMEDSGKPLSGAATETADETIRKVPMHKSEASFWHQEDPAYLAKSAANPFAKRSTGQNVSYRVDELIALQDASQTQRLAKSTFDYINENDELAKGAFKKLEQKLEGEGTSEESAGAIAASVGDKKYGKKNMEQAAAAGKPLAKGEAEEATAEAVEANRKTQAAAKKNEAEEVRQIKTDEKLSRIESQGQKMPLVKSTSRVQPTALNDLIEKGLDLTQSDVLVAQGVASRKNQGACLVKSFADAEMDALFKSQDMWVADEGKKPEALEKAGKAGEGSRGGKIAGHTRSGKPIYEARGKAARETAHAKGDHSEKSEEHHKDYSLQDHIDAYAFHGVKRREPDYEGHKNGYRHEHGQDFHDRKIGEMTNGHQFTDDHKKMARDALDHYRSDSK